MPSSTLAIANWAEKQIPSGSYTAALHCGFAVSYRMITVMIIIIIVIMIMTTIICHSPYRYRTASSLSLSLSRGALTLHRVPSVRPSVDLHRTVEEPAKRGKETKIVVVGVSGTARPAQPPPPPPPQPRQPKAAEAHIYAAQPNPASGRASEGKTACAA